MRIQDVGAVWLRCPIPAERQHVSDFGRLATFDTVLVTVTAEDGLRGYGEARPAVGSAGTGSAIVALVDPLVFAVRPVLTKPLSTGDVRLPKG